MPEWSPWTAWTASALIVFFLLLSNTLLIFYDRPFFYDEYNKLGVYSKVDPDTAKYATENMLDYLTFRADSLNGFFSEREIAHLKDVKGLVLAGHILALLLFAGIAALLYVLYRKKLYKRIRQVLVRQSYAMAGLLIAAFLLRRLFSFFFVLFHKIFFSNDLWLLDPTMDRLILLLPQRFFMDATASIVIRSLLLSAAIAGTALLVSRIMKRVRKE